MKTHGPLTPLAEALAAVRARCRALPGEDVALAAAADRILTAPVVAPRDLPAGDISMMDGYALRAADAGRELRVALEIAAGDAPAARALQPGEAARIFTGAPVPPGADCVAMQEHCSRAGAAVRVDPAHPVRPGLHLRRRGEEVAAGAQVLPEGALLRPAELALAAACGRTRLSVHRRPRVALLATGDELVPAGVEPEPGQIIETNSVQLSQVAREAGAEFLFLGISADDVGAIAGGLRDADADLLVTTGGASVGDHDHAQEALASLGGTLVFHSVAIRPGKPILFGTAAPRAKDGPPRLVFGLPGNPAANMLGFELFVRPAARVLAGDPHPERQVLRAVLRGSSLARVPGLTFFPRGRLGAEGSRLVFTPGGHQSSMQIGSFAGANAVAQIPPGEGRIEPGEEIPVLLVAAF
ncbi:MAG: molybdopterin molybdotransferase MoeA [Myxococcales bacterium]